MLFLVITHCLLHRDWRFHSPFCKCVLDFAEINVSFCDFLRGDILIFQHQVGFESRDGNTEINSFLFLSGRPTGKSKNKFPQSRQV